ncbi:MAG TPA: hypothetical protein VGL66_16610 [Caulobacteraceae bacterium]
MADELLENMIVATAEDESSEAAAEPIARPDPAAASLSLSRRRKSAKGDVAASEFLVEERAILKKQERLLEIQIEQLDDETAFKHAHFANRRWREKLQLGLQIFVVIGATVIGVMLLSLLVGAFNSRQVIIDSFDAPPALAQRGLTGKVVASGVIDELTRLQSLTHNAAVERHQISNAWSNDIKVEVPETGVSFGDIDRYLKQRFGHDIRVGGDLVVTDDGGLALTVRGDDIPPKTFTGGPRDLGKLTTQAAEYLFGRAEPARYATYLITHNRNAEAITEVKAAYLATRDNRLKAQMLVAWANADSNLGGDPHLFVQLNRKARALAPDWWPSYNNIINGDLMLGQEETARRDAAAFEGAAGGWPGRAGERLFTTADLLTWNLGPWRAAMVEDVEANDGVGMTIVSEAPSIADIDIRLHDYADAQVQLSLLTDDPNDPSIAAIRHFLQGRLAEQAGDPAHAASEMEAFGDAFPNPLIWTNYPGYNCWVAPAEEAAGHPDKADALLAKAGTFVDCWRFKGDVLDHRGDWAGAQKQYAAAVALAPDLPAAYYSWGLALARHGDLNGAVARFAAANKRGPHWADPLKAWGDVLARQEKWDEALKRYDEAAAFAPAWTELQQARAQARRKV